MIEKKPYDLEDRLIRFSIQMLTIAELLVKTRAGNHIAGQLERCGTSPSFNNGEAQAAESPEDFIHKLRVVLKELKETRVCLKIIILKPLLDNPQQLNTDIQECNELIAIFRKSIETAEKNKGKRNKE